jgi:hypothetical protein
VRQTPISATPIHFLLGRHYPPETCELKDDGKAVAACGGRPKDDP